MTINYTVLEHHQLCWFWHNLQSPGDLQHARGRLVTALQDTEPHSITCSARLGTMRFHTQASKRSGTTVVEAAIVFSAVFVLLIGILVAGMGVVRYQEVAHIARETARYASVHGNQYALANPNAAAVDLAALNTYAASKAVTLDTSLWTVTVSITCYAPGASTQPAPRHRPPQPMTGMPQPTTAIIHPSVSGRGQSPAQLPRRIIWCRSPSPTPGLPKRIWSGRSR